MIKVSRFATLIVLASVLTSAQTFVCGQEQYIKLAHTQPQPQPQPFNNVHACKPGPWGNLEYHYVYLEAPTSTVDLINVPSQKAVWRFPGKDAPGVREFLVKAGSPENEVERCLTFSLGFQVGDAFSFFPSTELINELKPEARQRVYAELRRWPENKSYHLPVVIASGDIDDWFKNSGLRKESISQIKRLSYPLGKALGFSDVSTVIQTMYDDNEERAFLKALTRTRSLILSLRIDSNSDTEALKEYWSAGYKSKDVLPLFEAVARIDGLDTIDVCRLLPPTPRKYLYTFPSQSLAMNGIYPDSFWASLNFFNYLPDDQFDDFEKVMEYAKANYDISTGSLRFGDLIIMKEARSGRIIHSCVFVAADIVYSKNGRSLLQPFMLIKLDDLFNRFSIDEKPVLEVWKKKER